MHPAVLGAVGYSHGAVCVRAFRVFAVVTVKHWFTVVFGKKQVSWVGSGPLGWLWKGAGGGLSGKGVQGKWMFHLGRCRELSSEGWKGNEDRKQGSGKLLECTFF